MGAQGTSTIDFGSWPGNNEASIAVTGQAAITALSSAEAFMMSEVSGVHTVNDAKYAALFIALTCTVPSAGTGFTIDARSEYKLTGTFVLRWVWN
jgi:hypothetical protein